MFSDIEQKMFLILYIFTKIQYSSCQIILPQNWWTPGLPLKNMRCQVLHFGHGLIGIYRLAVWRNLKWLCYIVRNLCQNSILRDAKMHNQKYNIWELVYSEKISKETYGVKWVKDKGRIMMQTHFRYLLWEAYLSTCSVFFQTTFKLYCSLLGEEPKTSDFESEFLMLLSHTQLNLLLQESLPSQ